MVIERGPRLPIDSQERFNQSLYEIGEAVLEKDAKAIADIYDQESVIEHFSAMAHADIPLNMKKVGVRNKNFDVIRATPEEIKQIYEGNPRLKLFVARDVHSRVVGTVTVEKPAPKSGILSAGIARIATSEEVRGKGISRMLLKTANAYVFGSPKDGGLGCMAAQAGVIKVAGFEKPLSLFFSEGYRSIAELPNNCISWDNKRKLFLPRDVMLVRRQAQGRVSKIEISNLFKVTRNN